MIERESLEDLTKRYSSTYAYHYYYYYNCHDLDGNQKQKLIVPRDKFSISLKRTEENRLAHRNESKRRTNNSKSKTNNVTEDKDVKGFHLCFF